MYNPTGEGGHQGGGVAAPIGSQVLGEVLPYLEIKKDNEQEEEKKEVEVPNIIGMTEKEAKQEASRCLRCDHFGYGIFKGGRETLW